MRFLDAEKLQIGFKFLDTIQFNGYQEYQYSGSSKLYISDEQIYFKGFLDKNDISFQYEMYSISYAGTSGLNSVPFRILKNYNLDFSVYSEHLDEAIVNYRNLHKMMDKVTSVEYEGSAGDSPSSFSLLTKNANQTANLSVRFRANPLLYSQNPDDNAYDVLVSKFQYSVIDDHGYVLYPFSLEGNRPEANTNYNNEVLIPLAFKISISAIIDPAIEKLKLQKASVPAASISSPASPTTGQAQTSALPAATQSKPLELSDLQNIFPRDTRITDSFISYINTGNEKINTSVEYLKQQIAEYKSKIEKSGEININMIKVRDRIEKTIDSIYSTTLGK